MWCPTRGVSIWPSETRHAQHEKCGWLKGGPKGARYARIAAGDLRRCPPPFSQPLCSAMSSMHRCCSSELKRRTNFKIYGQESKDHLIYAQIVAILIFFRGDAAWMPSTAGFSRFS